jgi:hypothetical protein
MRKAYLTTIDAVSGKVTEPLIRNISEALLEERGPNDLARVEIKLGVVDGKVDTTCIMYKLRQSNMILTGLRTFESGITVLRHVRGKDKDALG